MIKIPEFIRNVAQGNKPLSPGDYYNCFRLALQRMSQYLFNKDDRYQLDFHETDYRINDEEAARHDFYSHFECRRTGNRSVIKYGLTSAFFKYSYNGLYKPDASKGSNETDAAFWSDCATNYLLKNFLHNYVHERAQQITSANFHHFGDEARYFSDFEADNFANILLARSYNLPVEADNSDQVRKRSDIEQLFARNQCNRVFFLREQARSSGNPPKQTVESFLEKEWLIRRRFANQMSILLLGKDRAVSSISVHFFDKLSVKRNRVSRPNTRASVELNGVRFAMGKLGNVTALSRDEIKEATTDFVKTVDTQYATCLREDTELRRYANTTLRAKIALLLNQPRSGNPKADRTRRRI